MRRALLLLTLALAVQSLPGQTLPAELRAKAVGLLESSSLTDKAWGAHLIASLHLTDLQDRLAAELRSCRDWTDAPADSPEYAYVQQLLDSLIQLDATVPADLIWPLRLGHRAEVMILLLRNGASEELLLELMDRAINDTEWLAIAKTLVERRSGRIFDRLIDGLPITHSFRVVDPGGTYSIEAGFSNGLGSVFRARRLAKGFPPTGVYRLTRFSGSSPAMLAAGPANVYSTRTVIPTSGAAGWAGGGPDEDYTNRANYRVALIAARSGYAQELLWKMVRPHTEITWRTVREFNREVALKLDEQAAAIRDFFRRAKLSGATNMKRLRIEIEPRVDDFRKGKAGKLPAPAPQVVEIDLN